MSQIPKFLPSFWPCFPTGCSSSYVLGYHRIFCFTFKVNLPPSRVLHRWELCLASASGKPAHRLGPVVHWRQLLPTHRPIKDYLPRFVLTVTYLLFFFRLPVAEHFSILDLEIWDSIRAHSQHLFSPVGRTNSRFWAPVRSSQTLRYDITPSAS